MRGLTPDERTILEVLQAFPEDCERCNFLCGMRTVGTDPAARIALVRDGRAITWPCLYTTLHHGRITDAGRLALRLAPLLLR